MLTQSIVKNALCMTKNSFTRPETLQAWSTIIGNFKPRTYLEIGAFEGQSLALFATLGSYFSEANLHITSIDSWDGGDEHKKSGFPIQSAESTYDSITSLFKTAIGNSLTIEKIKGLSRIKLAELQARDNFYDLIFIDAGHKSKDVLTDMVLSWPLLKDGGIMILDDYTWIATHAGQEQLLLNSPRMGINAFIDCHADEATHLSLLPLLQLYLRKQNPLHSDKNAIALRPLPIPEIAEAFHVDFSK